MAKRNNIMYYKLAIVLALVSCAVARIPYSRVRATPWKDCGTRNLNPFSLFSSNHVFPAHAGSTNVVINNVEVEGCSASPCQLPKGTNVSVAITFTPSKRFVIIFNCFVTQLSCRTSIYGPNQQTVRTYCRGCRSFSTP